MQPFGSEWKVFRTYQTLAEPSATYSYPSPFSPDDEVVRIHYTVSRSSAQSITIRIFDFAMQPVRTLIQNAQRAGPREYDEIWDGNDNSGKRVANGVYFYRVEVDDAEPIWGKIFAIQ